MEGSDPSVYGTGPPRPAKLTVDFYELPDGLAIHVKRGGGPWVFLLFWLTGWTVGCVALAFMVVHQPSWGTLAFAIPFWASWIFVASLLTWMLFGKETLLLKADEALFVRTAIVRLSSRVVPRAEIQGFRECRSSHTENDEHLWGIEMVTLGKPLRLAYRLPDDERAWLIDQLNGHLRRTAPAGWAGLLDQSPAIDDADPDADGDGTDSEDDDAVNNAAEDDDTEDDDTEDSDEAADAEKLDYDRTLAAPPTDGDWRLDDGVDEFAFEQRGHWRAASLGLLLFINLFWNGIVTVFVLVLFGQMPGNNAPQGGEWWGLFLFLIPFELIGLGMFAAFCLAAVEPWRRTVWRFERYRIVRQLKWPLYRRTRGWDIGELDRLELRPGGVAARSGGGDAETRFSLAFVSRDNAVVCEIDKLTEGEARWMARMVFDRRRKWFDGRGGRFGDQSTARL